MDSSSALELVGGADACVGRGLPSSNESLDLAQGALAQKCRALALHLARPRSSACSCQPTSIPSSNEEWGGLWMDMYVHCPLKPGMAAPT